MVKVETSELNAECGTWREQLYHFRAELRGYKDRLQDVFNMKLNHESLLMVEHLQNQFHIQLINVHDLKQRIKAHCRNMASEVQAFKGMLRDESIARHDFLLKDYQQLRKTLHRVSDEFDKFTKPVFSLEAM